MCNWVRDENVNAPIDPSSIFLSEKCVDRELRSAPLLLLLLLLSVRVRNLVVSDLRAETQDIWLKSDC